MLAINDTFEFFSSMIFELKNFLSYTHIYIYCVLTVLSKCKSCDARDKLGEHTTIVRIFSYFFGI